MGEAKQATPEIEKAVQVTVLYRISPKIVADITLEKGQIAAANDNFQPALADLHNAYRQYAQLKDQRGQGIALQAIGSLYYLANDHPAALRYYAQARDAYSGDPQFLMSLYGNEGAALFDQRQFADAEAKFAQSLAQIDRNPKLKGLQGFLLANLASAQIEQNKFAAASNTLQRMRALPTSARTFFQWHIEWIAARLAFRQGNLREAIADADRAFAGVDLATTTSDYRAAHETVAEIYTAANMHARANIHLRALQRIDTESAKVTASAAAALMAARFDFAAQDAKIAQLKAQSLERAITYERARIQQQRLLGMTAVVLALAALGLLVAKLRETRKSRDAARAMNEELEGLNGRLNKALAAKSEFLSTTSHEIRTPLNGILGMTQIMLTNPRLDDQTRDQIGIVQSAGQTMRALIDDILDLAKYESGNFTIQPRPFHFSDLIVDVARIFELQAKERGLQFTVTTDMASPMVMLDPSRIRQIVLNLLSNAFKFTQAGSVALTVRLIGDRIQVSVRDSGIGIDMAWQEQIFEMFRQVDSGTHRQFGGTGLGLAISRKLARAMGGDVRVESMAGQGATFTLELPYVAAADTILVAASNVDRPAALIVEAQPIVRARIKMLLLDAGFIDIDGQDSLSDDVTINRYAIVIADATHIGDGSGAAINGLRDRLSAEAISILLHPANSDVSKLTQDRLNKSLVRPFTEDALRQCISEAARFLSVKEPTETGDGHSATILSQGNESSTVLSPALPMPPASHAA